MFVGALSLKKRRRKRKLAHVHVSVEVALGVLWETLRGVKLSGRFFLLSVVHCIVVCCIALQLLQCVVV